MIVIFVSSQDLKDLVFGPTKDNNIVEFIQKRKSGNVKSVVSIVYLLGNYRSTWNFTNKKSATFVEKLLEILGHILPVVECARNMQNCKNITNLNTVIAEYV